MVRTRHYDLHQRPFFSKLRKPYNWHSTLSSDLGIEFELKDSFATIRMFAKLQVNNSASSLDSYINYISLFQLLAGI